MSSEVAIRVHGLSKCYEIYEQPRHRLLQLLFRGRKQFFREFWALHDVSFEIKRGETVGIIGRNGSGKSTLLQLLCGTLAPTNGSVQVNGRIAALLELGAGFNPEFTGRENVFLSASLYGLSRDQISERFEKISEFADIGEFIDQPVKTYSSGMFVRLAFAVVVHVDPDILVIDEALAVGDSAFVHKCFATINRLVANGVTLIFVTHDMTAVRSLCKRAFWIDRSRLMAIGSPGEIADKYLVSIEGGRMPVAQVASHSGGSQKQVVTTGKLTPSARYGDQSISVMAAKIINCENADGNRALVHGCKIRIELTLVNNAFESDSSLVVGYVLRNQKGLDIASNNSEDAETAVYPCAQGGRFKINISTTLPFVHPGSYALSISIGCRLEDGQMKALDYLENGLVFDVMGKENCHVLLAMPSDYEVVYDL
ncbi:ABC transporter ATP-binding protein [Noviherbaspirillum sp. UKPF54]|uniref:ABC transporter ATP-binding protein n=1 Tax=Noviherbaspirillum sp. UKPF54 TaxID=2601898 RepID=UPI0011B13EE1|nr:ABC transporter ATP-binding protein [Noviherbaspirillum sp. UKPF54]QDZ28860.1 ABC transporter ATP-binding protein [Noviherbaspirillum sp. UKPF54]